MDKGEEENLTSGHYLEEIIGITGKSFLKITISFLKLYCIFWVAMVIDF